MRLENSTDFPIRVNFADGRDKRAHFVGMMRIIINKNKIGTTDNIVETTFHARKSLDFLFDTINRHLRESLQHGSHGSGGVQDVIASVCRQCQLRNFHIRSMEREVGIILLIINVVCVIVGGSFRTIDTFPRVGDVLGHGLFHNDGLASLRGELPESVT